MHANDQGLERGKNNRSSKKLRPQSKKQFTRSIRTSWENFPTQSPLCGGNDGVPSELDGITVSKWRIESIKAYGNAVCPQVVLQLFKAIEAYEAI